MKSSSSTEFTARDGRRFAFPVGAAFAVLAGILWWRGRVPFAWTATALSGALLLAGVILPARLGPVYRGWMRMALAISKVTTPIFMGVVYFLVLTPFGWAMRAVGKKPIAHRPENGSFWRPAGSGPKDLRRQF